MSQYKQNNGIGDDKKEMRECPIHFIAKAVRCPPFLYVKNKDNKDPTQIWPIDFHHLPVSNDVCQSGEENCNSQAKNNGDQNTDVFKRRHFLIYKDSKLHF